MTTGILNAKTEAHFVALVLEFARQQGYSAERLKALLNPQVIDAWFQLKEARTP